MSITPKYTALLAAATLVILGGCGEQSKAAKPMDFTSMTVEVVQTEIARLRQECRNLQGDPDKPGSPCAQLTLAERAIEDKGWCWGPQAAARSDMSWMRCEEDVTRSPQAQGPWYVVTKSGACREVQLGVVIGKVLAHDGQWNVKTWITPEGVFNVSSRTREGNVASVEVFPSCGAALMTYITLPERPTGASVAAPLGFSPRDAADFYGFDVRSCAAYSFGRGIGCNVGFSEGMNAPIAISGGFTPCAAGRTVQFDFAPNHGMVGVTCAASTDSQAALRTKMSEAFGEPKVLANGSLVWTLGDYSVRSSKEELLGQTLRKVSVHRNAW